MTMSSQDGCTRAAGSGEDVCQCPQQRSEIQLPYCCNCCTQTLHNKGCKCLLTHEAFLQIAMLVNNLTEVTKISSFLKKHFPLKLHFFAQELSSWKLTS